MGKLKVGYVRVSSVKQTEGLSPENQKSRLEAYDCDVILKDVESGRKSSRQGYQKIIAMVRKGEVSEVVAIRLDRIGRSLIDAYKFYQLLEEHQVKLTLLDMPVDFGTSSGKLFFNQFAAFAQFEVDLLAEKQRSQHQFRRANRMAVVPPFGYVYEKGLLLPDLSQYGDSGLSRWQVAREVIDTFLRVGTERGTVKALGRKYGFERQYAVRSDFPRSGTGLGDYLDLPALRGHLHYPKTGEIFLNQHEPLMSESEYKSIQTLKKRALAMRGGAAKGDTIYPLSGLVKCVCGSNCSIGLGGNKTYGTIAYYCCHAHRKAVCSDQPEGGRRPSIRADYLEVQVIEALIQKSQEVAIAVGEAMQEVQSSAEVLAIERQLEQLRAIDQGGLTGQLMAEMIQRVEAERDNLIAQLQAGTKTIESEFLKEIAENFADPEFLDSREPHELRQIFYMFVEKIVVRGRELVEIKLRI